MILNWILNWINFERNSNIELNQFGYRTGLVQHMQNICLYKPNNIQTVLFNQNVIESIPGENILAKIMRRGWHWWHISCFGLGRGFCAGGEMYIMQIARITLATLRGTFGSLLLPPIYPQKKSESSTFKVLSLEFITGFWVGKYKVNS